MSLLVQSFLRLAREKKFRVCSAESVTGGQVAMRITSVAGSSDVFYSGMVAYDTESKIKFLDIPKEFFQKCSVYSKECAEKMAENWRKKCDVDICISTTGEAENSQTVFFGISTKERTKSVMKAFSGTRNDVQKQATEYALKLLLLELRHSRKITSLFRGEVVG